MTVGHYIGAIFVFIIITAIGLYSGRKVKSAGDFSLGGRKASTGIVTGSIIGTLVGGASTIGTAQLAFSYGFSAWWFTLGGGIGCLVLAVFFLKPIYTSGVSTLPQILSREYGQKAGVATTLLTSMGSFLSLVSQILSGIALITAVSTLNPLLAMLLIVVLMLFYVVFGGVWGAGYVGITKTVLLCAAIGACGILAIRLQGGIDPFLTELPREQYFNLFARGIALDGGAGLSLVLGILTTQAYIQAVLSAKTLEISRTGVILSALLIPLVGVGGIFVGIYMKLNYPDIVPGTALPLFVMEKLPPLIGGIVLATLLVALVGTGAGLSLGFSSMFCNDIYKVYINKIADDKKTLFISRAVIVIILLFAAFFSSGNMGSLILGWSFLSMGLRGAVAFGPLCAALFLPGKISGKFAVASMIIGPLTVIAAKFIFPAHIDPLYPGVLINLAVLFIGWIVGHSASNPDSSSV